MFLTPFGTYKDDSTLSLTLFGTLKDNSIAPVSLYRFAYCVSPSLAIRRTVPFCLSLPLAIRWTVPPCLSLPLAIRTLTLAPSHHPPLSRHRNCEDHLNVPAAKVLPVVLGRICCALNWLFTRAKVKVDVTCGTGTVHVAKITGAVESGKREKRWGKRRRKLHGAQREKTREKRLRKKT